MLIDRARQFVFLLLFTLLASCGGGGGNPGQPGPGPVAGAGSLTLTITGLPSGTQAAIRVTGPSGFTQDLTQSQTLANLAAGAYTVSASNVAAGGTTWLPAPPTQSIAVSGGATAAATVNYATTAPASLSLRQVASGLAAPVFLTAPAGDNRQFIVERGGRIRVMQDETLLSQPFLDISGRVFTGGEGGLLSMAFHPQYAANGYFFIYYTDTAQNIVVERFNVSPNPNLADPTSALAIIRIPHPGFTNHFGGLVSFGPDGYLYLGTGDGGGAGDPQRNAQNLNSLLGKLLRLDVSASSASQPYAIPPANPFAGQAGRRPEIWAYGLRNPWRFTFDGSQLYIADVGEDRREEVNISNLAAGGLNYGWNISEGTACYNATSCDLAGITLPAFEYDHGANDVNGCSITGGFVYRGTAIPGLAGRYFYSDYCGGYLRSFFAAGGGVTEQTSWLIPAIGRVISFGRDADGELYLLAADGGVYKISRGTGASG